MKRLFFLLMLTLLCVGLPPAAAQDATPVITTPDPEATPDLLDENGDPIGTNLTFESLLALKIEGSDITFEQQLADGSNYSQYIASYVSEGNKIYGLLTVPFGIAPENGFKAIVFNHGFIPPDTYVTTGRYVAYVRNLAANGFVVFKIDLRGHGNSEGEAQGTYFSPGYTIDAISAVKSLQTLDFVDPDGIGMWGHSMAGNLLLRAMLIEPDIKAGVIWAGAVYSYADLTRYSIDDPSAQRLLRDPNRMRRSTTIREVYGDPGSGHPFWDEISLVAHLNLLQHPVQIHHAINDPVVSVRYSNDLAAALAENDKTYEMYQYDGGGHNIDSPYFETAMQRTIQFFKNNL